MRYLILFLIIAVNLCAWETTTHRAIDKTAIESQSVVNLPKEYKEPEFKSKVQFIHLKNHT